MQVQAHPQLSRQDFAPPSVSVQVQLHIALLQRSSMHIEVYVPMGSPLCINVHVLKNLLLVQCAGTDRTAKRTAPGVSQVACQDWHLRHRIVAKWDTATRHCFPTAWRVCGVSPMSNRSPDLVRQGGHDPEDVPPYAQQHLHMQQACYMLGADGQPDHTTWTVCQ